MSENIYYNYIYLDPRKPGKFCYPELNFSLLYEPFYVGKGCGTRLHDHLKPFSLKHNSYKNNKIKKLISQFYDIKNFIIKPYNNITNLLSQEKEKMLIQVFGRYDLKLGPLTNKSGGGEIGYTGNISSVKKLTNNKRIACDICGTKSTNLEKHIRLHHTIQPKKVRVDSEITKIRRRESALSRDPRSNEKIRQTKLKQGNTFLYTMNKMLLGINGVEFCFFGTKKDIYRFFYPFTVTIVKNCYLNKGKWIKCKSNSFKIEIIDRPYQHLIPTGRKHWDI